MNLERLVNRAGMPVIAALIAAGLGTAVVQTYVVITHDKGPGGFIPSALPSEPLPDEVTTSTTSLVITLPTVPSTIPAEPAETNTGVTTKTTVRATTRTTAAPVVVAPAVTTTTSTTVEDHGGRGGNSGRGGPPGGDD